MIPRVYRITVLQRCFGARRSLTAAAAGTSKQKRALNPDQLEGQPTSGTPHPPPISPTPPIKSVSSSQTDSLVPYGIAGAVALAGGSIYYFQSRASKASADVSKETANLAAEQKKDEKPKQLPKASASVEKQVEQSKQSDGKSDENAGNRVVSIQVPDKMKGASALPTQTIVTSHPPAGNRVSIHPPRKEAFSIQDVSMAKKAIADLDTSPPAASLENKTGNSDTAAVEAVIKSHQSLWASVDEAFFADLDSLNAAQLKARVVQLATEMRDRTKWEAVRLKEFLAMKEKETADKYTALMQKQRLEFEDVLAQRSREQEAHFLQQLQATIREKEETIQGLLNSALEAQKHEHEADKKAFEETKAAEIKSQLEEDYGKQFEAYKEKMAHDLQHKVNTLENLSKKLKYLESALSATRTSQQGSIKAHRLSAAAMALSEKLETSQSVEAEIAALKSVAGDVGVIATALATIPEGVKSGVPTLPQLQTYFEEMHQSCRQAALVPEGRLGLDGHLAGMLLAKLKFPPNIDDPAPENDKNNAEYVLIRAKKHVQLGELRQAVEQLDKLKGLAAFVASDWKKDAMNRIAVDKAIKVIKMECALVNESLLD